MDGRRILFRDWEDEQVAITFANGNTMAGVLEEVNELGIVANSRQSIWWTTETVPDEEGYTHTKHVDRQVQEFYTWATIASIRLMEPDEAEAYGL